MDSIYGRCAGPDVHKKTVVACIRTLAPNGQVEARVRTFGTMTANLLELGDWLAEHGATHVAMESTGVYWKPVFNLPEGRFDRHSDVTVAKPILLPQLPASSNEMAPRGWRTKPFTEAHQLRYSTGPGSC